MKLRAWAERLEEWATTIALAVREPRTPWPARLCGALTMIYWLSPIDLVPDDVPVLGYVGDLVLIPLGFWASIRLIPRDVWTECAERAKREDSGTKRRHLWLAIATCALAMAWSLALAWASGSLSVSGTP